MLQQFRINLKSNLLIYKYYANFKNRFMNGHYSLAKTGIDLCIEAYPSSANTYLQSLLEEVNKDLTTAHHTHSVANMKMALVNDIPLVVIIRKPLDAITSRLVRFPNTNTNFALLEYYSFYSYVLNNINNLVIINFSELINSPLGVIERVNPRLSQNKQIDISKIDIERIVENTKKKIIEGENDNEKLALPSEKRELEKDHIKSVLEQNEILIDCDKIYNEILKNMYKK
ncbi:hypothetical protein E3U55_14105 [Filobacillus milosensis]|uniref:Sulfotransferase family protein n=1 Tax=Filobacillus milosensis TaxID=94137 RepID=A0A4Y8IDW0_9BACI|nr:hypothetical protein [Filobacillus milosensis]TFB14178.1 hypothetical protein E3U55_14105 [Filobacillus milosensis]